MSPCLRRNDSDVSLRSRDIILSEACKSFALEKEGARDPQERARGRPGARCTRGLVCNMHKGKRTRAYRFSGGSPAFPAQWFYGLSRALLGDRAWLTPSPADIALDPIGSMRNRRLDAGNGASGPHDFAVRNRPSSPKGLRRAS